MRLMMLGASKAQLQGIVMAKEMGNEVVSCDYIPEAIGHKYSDYQCLESTFDIDAVLKSARDLKIDGIMTMGTDQPVYTVNCVAEAMNLPKMLTSEIARSVTHKKVMKTLFDEHHIPTVDWMVYEAHSGTEALKKLRFPAVIKPMDAQGQRGVFYVKSASEAIKRYRDVAKYSRETFILAETHYPHEEVTVSGWVQAGEVHVLAITDRITFDHHDQIGICLAHRYPSKHCDTYGEAIINLTEKIVHDFGIHTGPIYFQMLLGDEGVKVNEIACRIGGAYEGTYLPLVTGFNLCEAMLLATMGEVPDVEELRDYNPLNPDQYVSVQLFFSKPCTLAYRPEMWAIKALKGVIDCGFNYDIGDVIGAIDNATDRAGYVIVIGDSEEQLKSRLDQLYEKLVFKDAAGINQIIHNNY